MSAFRHVFFLHGFVSSAKSTKGEFFAGRLQEHGVALHRLDFNEPSFETMTMTRMIEQLAAALRPLDGPATLIGSSLGGSLAILAAGRLGERIDRLVLLAPAVMFASADHHLVPPERVEEWRRQGALPFFHYGYGEERRLNFSFYEDSLRYDAFNTRFTQPTLIFQGMRDEAVPYRSVEAFANARANVTLSLLDDEHQLLASLPRIWESTEPFLGLVE